MNEQAYQAAQTGAVYVDQSTAGCVQLSGPDRLDVVNRLSTNKVDTLQPGQGQATIFTNHNGRIMDLVSVLQKDNDALIVTSKQRGPEIAAYLQRNKFFNDSFTVKDLSDPASQLHIYGPQARALLQHWTDEELANFELWQHSTLEIDGCPLRVQRIKPIYGDGWRLMTDVAGVEAIGEALDEQGAVFLDQETYKLLRIEHGYPGLSELQLDYIPLEANLWDAVSFKKGCYVGQEIIARMESRGRLAKKLVGVELQASIETPYTIESADKPLGVITSLAFSPQRERWIGLAYMRNNAWDAGNTIQLAEQTLHIRELPFIAEQATP